MPVSASTLSKLIAAGLSGQDLIDVVASIDADMDSSIPNEVRSAGAARQERYRQRKASQSVTSDVTGYVTPSLSSPEGSSPTPPSPKPLQSIPPSPPKGGSSPKDHQLKAEFESEFWPIYPHKVGKPVALASFLKARQRAPLDVIIPGLRRYVAKTDDRPWCNASTWLNQDRWDDLPAQVARGQPPPRERDLADIFNDMAKQGYHDDGRTIEGSYEHRDFDGPRQALPRLAAPPRQS